MSQNQFPVVENMSWRDCLAALAGGLMLAGCVLHALGLM